MQSPILELKEGSKIEDEYKFIEFFNHKILTKLINSDKLNNSSWLSFENEKDQLTKYIKNSKHVENNIYKRVVSYKRKCNFGRVYPIGSIGLCSLRREIRHSITNNIYMDIDIQNCHPEILYQTLLYYNVKNIDLLGDYVINRDKYLNDVMEFYNVKRDSAKALFISLLYGSSFNEWIQIEKVENNKTIQLEIIQNIVKSRIHILHTIKKHNIDLVDYINNNKLEKNNSLYYNEMSIVSLWCQELEFRILETLINYCIEKRYINKNTKNAVLCFDGFMILKEKFKITMLEEFNNIIKNKFGLDLKFTIKEMNQGYTFVNNDNNNNDNNNNDNNNDNDEGIQILTIKQQDKEFFKNIKNMGQKQMADIFYNIKKDKYFFSSNSGWWKLNKYNIFENTNKQLPENFLIDISKTLTDYLIPIRNRMIPTDEHYCDNSKEINKILKSLNGSGNIKGIIDFLQNLFTDSTIDDKIDKNTNLIAFTNKLFDLEIKAFRDILPSDYIKTNTGYEYKPSNPSNRQELYEDFIMSVFGTEEGTKYCLSIRGESLFGNKNNNVYMEIGRGGNGKSIINSTLMANALGGYCGQADNDFITNFKNRGYNESLADAKNNRILIISEPTDSDEFGRESSLNVSFLKLITGGDLIKTSKKGAQSIEYKANFTPFIQCNTLPNIKKLDNGITRRIKIINYPFMFVDNPTLSHHRQIDRTLRDKFNNVEFYREFLLMMIDAHVNNINNNTTNIIPKSIQQHTNEYFDDNNPVKTFIDTHIRQVEPELKQKIKTTDLKAEYDLSFPDRKMHIRAFIQAMAFNGFDTYNSMGYKYFKNIEIVNGNNDINIELEF